MKMVALRWAALVTALAIGLAAPAHSASPRIAVSKDGESLIVSFDKGATWACTVYRMTEPTEPKSDTFPDGHYAPRHCWGLDTSMTNYTDDWDFIKAYDSDWDVYAEVGYPKDDTMVYISTNILRVHR